jgi:uncharacterized coiled-coil DUF342 family protein
MEHEADLNRLEKNVEKLLSRFDKIESDNFRLQNDIARLENDNQTLKGELSLLQKDAAQLRKEKNTVHQRVVSLIGSIEEWEKASLNKTVEDSGSGATAQAGLPSQGDLGFTAGA